MADRRSQPVRRSLAAAPASAVSDIRSQFRVHTTRYLLFSNVCSIRRRTLVLPSRDGFDVIFTASELIIMEVLKNLFERHFHAPVEQVLPLQGELGGSGRKVLRLTNAASSAIGILYNVREENIAFLEFSRHFRRHGLPVPEIYEEDLAHGAYLEEDLGDTTLFDFLSKNRSGGNIAPEVVEAYRKVVAFLPRFQIEAGRDLNYKVCYPRGSFDRQSIAWDLNYFKYYFLRLAGIPFSEQALEDDFSHLKNFLLSADHNYFLYRDFQSRNVMLRDGQPFF